jgi:hypothetical protein
VQSGPCRKSLTFIALFSGTLLAGNVLLEAQEAPKSASASPSQAEQPVDARVLSEAIRDLRSQVQSLKAELSEMKTQQKQASEDTRELRRQLSEAALPPSPGSSVGYGDLRSATKLEPPAPTPKASSNSEAPSPSQEPPTSATLAKMEENVQFIDAKVNDQYQTKVESGSKYRLRLSGIALLNLFSNRGAVENLDFPSLAVPASFIESHSSLGGTVRQSQLTVAAFGPDIAGAHTSANVTFDFAGGFPNTPNGTTLGIARLRIATMRFDWGDTSIVAGQDSLFLSPLAPSSLATLAVPPLSYSGNLWSWAPQVRIEHQFHMSESSALHLQFGILDSQSGDLPASSYERYPSWGEQSGQPAYAARIGWSRHLFGQELIAGLGGYYGRQSWALGRSVDGWAGTTDLTMPLGKRFQFSGEFYRGRAVGGLGGGADQTVLLSGSFTDPSTRVQGLDSMGGWAQLKFKPVAKFEVNVAFGQDNPFASEINLFPASANASYYGAFIERNRSTFVNFIYQPRSDVLFSVEYRRLRSFYVGGDSQSANHVNMSVGYIF